MIDSDRDTILRKWEAAEAERDEARAQVNMLRERSGPQKLTACEAERDALREALEVLVLAAESINWEQWDDEKGYHLRLNPKRIVEEEQPTDLRTMATVAAAADRARALLNTTGNQEPCATCGGKGLIYTGECLTAMSGPTCRNPDCPPCRTPDTEPCPDCGKQEDKDG